MGNATRHQSDLSQRIEELRKAVRTGAANKDMVVKGLQYLSSGIPIVPADPLSPEPDYKKHLADFFQGLVCNSWFENAGKIQPDWRVYSSRQEAAEGLASEIQRLGFIYKPSQDKLLGLKETLKISWVEDIMHSIGDVQRANLDAGRQTAYTIASDTAFTVANAAVLGCDKGSKDNPHLIPSGMDAGFAASLISGWIVAEGLVLKQRTIHRAQQLMDIWLSGQGSIGMFQESFDSPDIFYVYNQP